MRLWLATRWRLTPFHVKQRLVDEGATRLDDAVDLADQMGLVIPLEELKPPFEGPNAAHEYERLTMDIKGLANQLHGHPRSLQSAASARLLSKEYAERILSVWGGLLDSAQAATDITGCRLDDRYILTDSEFEALSTMKTLAYGYLVRLRLAASESTSENMLSDLHSIARLCAHAATEPLRIGALVSTSLTRSWFAAASVCLRVPPARSAVDKSLTFLPPVPTLRSTLAGEVSYARAYSEWHSEHFERMTRFRMPRHMLDDLKRLAGIGRASAAEMICAQCDLARRLPQDEAADGPASAKVFFDNVRKDVRGVLGIPTMWVLVTAPDRMKWRMWESYKASGAFAAMNQSMRNVIRMALYCYQMRDATGRFPKDLGGRIDPMTLQPYEYRNHGDRFLIFGRAVEFDSDPSAPPP